MLLGKRPRPPIKRSTSMSGITVDVSNLEPSDQDPTRDEGGDLIDHHDQYNMKGHGQQYDQSFLAMVSPRYYANNNNNNTRTSSCDETADFLRTCGLCQRRLVPGKDIYMYRGDTAFCSLECREKQMKQDKKKDRQHSSSSSPSKKKEICAHNASSQPPRATKSPHMAAA
ncbi:hypothetical protein ACFE04_016969 [Oxalis oulophora]